MVDHDDGDALNDALEVISKQERRELLLMLEAEDGSIDISSPEIIGDANEYEASRIRLFHMHLPKLADKGLVEWEPGDDVVRKGERFDEFVDLVETHDDIARSSIEDGRPKNDLRADVGSGSSRRFSR